MIWCYNVAEPGMFQGKLGFELVRTFTSYPNLGPLQFNTQFAEEAFTVYDHPKVMIFQKRADYDPSRRTRLLGAVDLRQGDPRHAQEGGAPGKTCCCQRSAWRRQQAGGTWASLFPPRWTAQPLPVRWGCGLVCVPAGCWAWWFTRWCAWRCRGLPDRGYPLARTAGLLLLAYLAWMAGSLGVPVTRVLLLAHLRRAGGCWGWRWPGCQRDELRGRMARSSAAISCASKLVALALFVLDLLIRLGNPDLWHPAYGGEKPMDFSYFNAVLKSTTFPPYDPWFAGGYINYYYYGFVLVGMPVKLLGITRRGLQPDPADAVRMVALGAFFVGWNLALARVRSGGRIEPRWTRSGAEVESATTKSDGRTRQRTAAWRRIAAGTVRRCLPLLILGNLGTVRMIWRGLAEAGGAGRADALAGT